MHSVDRTLLRVTIGLTIRVKRFCNVLIVGCYLLFYSHQGLSCSLILAVSANYAPHHIRNSEAKWSGASIDLARVLTERAGCQLSVLTVPWSRAVKLLELGDVDLLSNFSLNPQRAEFAEFLGPHYIENAAFIARKNVSEEVDSASKLPLFEGPIGITRGANFGPEF